MAVLEKNEMIAKAERVVNVAIARGACEAEAYVYDGQTSNVGIELGQVNKTNQIIDRGAGVRVVVNKAMGFAYTNIVNDINAVEGMCLER